MDRAKEGPPPSHSPIRTMRDAVRGDHTPEELRDFIQEQLGATIRRELKAMGFPVLPEAVLRISEDEK